MRSIAHDDADSIHCRMHTVIRPGCVGLRRNRIQGGRSRWRITYSDKPPSDRARPTNTLEFRNLPSSPLPAQVLRFREQLEKSAESRINAARAPRTGDVALFTASWCGHCKRAKAHLAAGQIAYVEYDIESIEGMQAFIGAGGKGGVPLLVAGERRIQGYSAPAYDRLAAAIRAR